MALPPDLAALRELLADDIRQAVADALAERERTDVEAVRAALGPHALVPYKAFLEAQNLSYDLGQKLREEGRLKVVDTGGKLQVSLAHAEQFVRSLPLNDPARGRRPKPARRRTGPRAA